MKIYMNSGDKEMAVVNVLDIKGNQKETIELNDKVFNCEIKPEVMHEAVVAYLANQRQGTKATKSRGEVNGTSKKPWRQKGTGRARSGSKKSPVWVGGGHTFALKPRDFSIRLSKSKRHRALCSALSSKLKDSKLIVVEDFNFDAPKTKQMNEILDNLQSDNSALMVLSEKNDIILKSSRNIPKFETIISKDLNTYQVLKSDYLILMKSSIKKIEEELLKK